MLRRSYLALGIVSLLLAACGGTILDHGSDTGWLLIGSSAIRPFNVSDGTLLGANVPLSQPIRDICLRSDGQLYGVGSNQFLYRIDTFSGVCTPAANSSLGFANNSFGIAIYPGTSQLRLVVSTGENYRYNAQIGTLINQDPNLNFQSGDANSGVPTVAAIAYKDGNTPQLFGIDGARDALVRITSENSGTTTTVGALGTNAGGDISMAIDMNTGTALAVWDGGGAPGLYRIDLSTGAATLVTSSIAGADGIAIPVN